MCLSFQFTLIQSFIFICVESDVFQQSFQLYIIPAHNSMCFFALFSLFQLLTIRSINISSLLPHIYKHHFACCCCCFLFSHFPCNIFFYALYPKAFIPNHSACAIKINFRKEITENQHTCNIL